jgi:diaminopimelate decarboxylase/aspartate kinase
LIKQLHGNLVRPSKDDAIFGPTLNELLVQPPVPVAREPWWAKKREQLIEIGTAESAAYVYDLDTVRQACERLRSLKNIDRVFYAIKANNHPAVLQVINEEGFNFECVSPGEIKHILKLFPDIDRHRILFTPNFAPRIEYEYAMETGIWVTLDNLHPLREWGEIFYGQDIFLRIDTGQGRGHHEHVRTAGVHSKFGIPLFELPELRESVDAAGASVVGLHAHTGSGILQADNWQDIAEALIAVAQDFPQVRILDLGGGLGIPEKPGQDALDMGQLDSSIAALRAANPDFELWLEPGRYLVAEAGVLLTSVTQTKGKGEVRYVGVSTGMNSLIRPALYGAYHEIANLSRLNEPSEYVVNIVGPICETGDKLGTGRLLPRCSEGDVLLLANTGAYGYVMSSGYNMRESAKELAI